MSLIATIDEFKLKYNNTDAFIINNKLSADVLEYYIENYEADWYDISIYQTLTEQFIEKYSAKLIWISISRCQTLSESFIEKYIDKVKWITISIYQTLSESFIEKYIDKVDWLGLIINKKITMSYEFLLKHLYEFNLYEASNVNNDNISRLIANFPDKYKLDKITYEFNNNN